MRVALLLGLVTIAVSACTSENKSAETVAAPTSVATFVPDTEAPSSTEASTAPSSTEASTTVASTTTTSTVPSTTLSPCLPREAKYIAGKRYECTSDRVFVESEIDTATTTTAPASNASLPPPTTTINPVLDAATLVWWQGVAAKNGASSQTQACRDGIKTAQLFTSLSIDQPTFAYICNGGSPALQGEPLTDDEVRSLLTAPAQAWAAAPSGPGYDALQAAAAGLSEQRRPFASPATANALTTLLGAYPGNDVDVYRALSTLGIDGIPTILDDGNYTVGVDVQPGRYKTLGPVDGCYWETLDASGEINDNNFVNAAPQVIATIRKGDFAFNSERCGPWVKIA